ncbi:hypothetical protein PGB90_005001 [Kerria lacca]
MRRKNFVEKRLLKLTIRDDSTSEEFPRRNRIITNCIRRYEKCSVAECYAFKHTRARSGESSQPYSNECLRDTEKDSLNEERGVISDNVERQFSMTGSPKLRSSKKLLGLLTQNRSHLFLSNYPFYRLWIHLSTLYGIMLLIIMFAVSLTEITDNSVKMFTLQGIYMMYLYIGSIAVIICIYVWVLIDSCSSIKSLKTDSSALAETAELTRFDSLKKAHISPAKTSNTSFYLRIGALAFGLGTLVFSGLEMAMHSMMETTCLTNIAFIHPILHALFTFLQMHFLFVNSQVLVEKFGLIARFGFMHLAATNIALWIKLIVIETGLEWIYFVYLAQNNVISSITTSYDNDVPTPLQLRGFPRFISYHYENVPAYGYNLSFREERSFHDTYKPVSDDHVKQIVALHYCINTNSLGQLWTSSMPFLYPFIIQFSLIAAGVTYVMGQNVGADRLRKHQFTYSGRKFNVSNNNCNNDGNNNNKKNCNNNCMKTESYMMDDRVDCNGISKGLFLGLLCLVVLTVVIIIFLVVKEDKDFPIHVLSMLTFTVLFFILVTCVIVSSFGLYQIRKLSYSGKRMSKLDTLLNMVSNIGVFLYSIFSVIVGANGTLHAEMHSDQQHVHLMLLIISILQITQCSMQSAFLAEAFQRQCLTRHQQLTKPGRQVVTFLLCANVGLWAYDSFLTESWLNQESQLQFYGLLTWGVISRISIPLCIFYRFHSSILLLEIWRRCYTNKHKEIR